MDSAAIPTMPVVDTLRARFGDAILDAAEALRGDPSVTVRADKALAVAQALREMKADGSYNRILAGIAKP